MRENEEIEALESADNIRQAAQRDLSSGSELSANEEGEPLVQNRLSEEIGLLEKEIQDPPTKWGHFTHWAARDFLFIDRIAERWGGKWHYVRHFADGARMVTNKLWPAAFLGLILHDFIVFKIRGLSDYGLTIPQILLGTADSQQILTTYLGSDLAREVAYWLGASIVFGAALGGGLLHLGLNRNEELALPSWIKPYISWSYGKKTPWKLALAFWGLTLYCLYAEARLYKIWIEKLMGEVNYRIAESDCSAQNRTYSYIEEFQNYVCVVCDWDFVDYWKRGNTQACLDGVLSQNQSPESLLNKLDTITRHKDFSAIDASKQNFLNWKRQQFSSFLGKFIESGVRIIRSFNLSAPFGNAAFPDDGRIDDLKHFFETIWVKIVDLRNQALGPAYAKILAPSLNRSIEIDYTGNELTNDGLPTVTQNLGRNTERLILDRNNIDDEGIENALPDMPPSVKQVSVAENKFGNRGLQAMGDWIAKGHVESIIIDKNKKLAAADFDDFGKKIEGGALKKLSAKEIGMNNDQIEDLMPHLQHTPLEELILSDNPIGNHGLLSALQGAINTTLSRLELDGILVDDHGLQLGGPLLQQTNLTHISLARLRASVSAFIQFVENLINSKIEYFNGSGNALGDAFLQACKEALSGLKTLVLDEIQASDEGSAPLILSAGSGKLERLSLSKNLNITDITLLAYRRIAKIAKLVELRLEGNHLGGQGGILSLAEAGPSSKLRDLLISGNIKIPSEEMYQLLTKLITNVPNRDLSSYDRDQIRWLQKYGKPSTNIRTIDADNNVIDTKTQRAASLVAYRADLSFSGKNATASGVGALLLSAGLFSPGMGGASRAANPAMQFSIDIGLALGVSAFASLLLLLLLYRVYKNFSERSEILPSHHLGRGL